MPKTSEELKIELAGAKFLLETFDYSALSPRMGEAKKSSFLEKITKLEIKIEAAEYKKEAGLTIKRDKEEAEAQKQFDLMKKLEEQNIETINKLVDLIEENDYSYSQHQDVYIKPVEGDYQFFSPNSIPRRHHLLDDGEIYKEFRRQLEVKSRKYDSLTYSFRDDLPNTIFNMVNKDDWLLPLILEDGEEEPEHHWLFDALMKSMGGGKQENMNHIEQVLVHKIHTPSNFRLPALVIYGEGGIGKNLFVDVVCHKIFDGLTISEEAGRIVGDFNSFVAGKAVIHVNEGKADKANMERFKNDVHKPRLLINKKYVNEFEVDNTPLYIFGSNDIDGAIKLGGDKSDRRWSIIKAETPLAEIVSDKMNITEDEAVAYIWDHNDSVLGNSMEIKKWLRYLFIKWVGVPVPTALHGEDYMELMQQQATNWEDLLGVVFNDPDFVNIERKVLYHGYEHVSKNTRNLMKNKTFYANVRRWLRKNNIQTILEDDRVRVNGSEKAIWYNAHKNNKTSDTTNDYISTETGFNNAIIIRWIGGDIG